MRRDGAESTASETPPVDVYRELDHLESWYRLPFVFRMGQAGVGQVERRIYFFFRHRWERGIDDYRLFAYLLQDAGSLLFVGFFLYVFEVLGLFQFVV
jgi:hypothetical protein